ncbi:transglycosylase domain-containing protein [Lactobacillus porci]|uniref:transglycosylase domain-containing protein n=1 Tax=Lactobacillus porci TaxID=2012477 RepID=UPI0039966436
MEHRRNRQENKSSQPHGHWLRRFNHRFQVIRWLILAILSVVLVTCTYYTFKVKTANLSNLEASLAKTTVIYDNQGKKAGSVSSGKGSYVGLSKISPNIQKAVVSTEDRTFWTNPGFSVKGIMRAFASYLIHHGNISGGGSTITQQLVKNSILTQQQTLSRKIAEIFYAVQVTKVYSKKQILTMYLNNAYFGNGVYGVQDASRKYFGKNASQVSLGEGATLAGMLRSPSYYNPIDSMSHATSRRNLVLELMVENQAISQAQCQAAQKTSLVLKDTYSAKSGYKYPYYFDAVIDEAVNKYHISENEIMSKGLKIYTSLNQNYQQAMQTSFKNQANFPASAADGTKVQGASVAMDPKTGAVAALVGGRGKHVFRGYNRATQMRRQPGSSIKPLAVYAAALEKGYHYDSELSNKRQSFGKNNYSPVNVDNQYSDQITMYQAIAQSKNVPAVWLLNKIGVSTGVSYLKKFGITVPKSDQNLALALGGLSTGVSPMQMARAYSAFANSGKLPDSSYLITKITDASGNVIAENRDTGSKQIISADTAKEMTEMLLSVFRVGTAVNAQPYGYSVAGKTGSTEVSFAYGTKDQWIVGYTPDVVVSTWVGFDKTDKTHYMQGISETGITSLYKAEMQALLPYSKQSSFKVQAADSMASSNGTAGKSSASSEDFGSKVKQSISDGLNNAKNKINSWYNNFKNMMGK